MDTIYIKVAMLHQHELDPAKTTQENIQDALDEALFKQKNADRTRRMMRTERKSHKVESPYFKKKVTSPYFANSK